MPRKPKPWTVTVAAFMQLYEDMLYRLRVGGVCRNGAGMEVTLVHLDADQAGRTHKVVLPLPVRPAGLTAEFFAACGFDASVGITITPGEAVNSIVGVRFKNVSGGEPKVAAFEPIHEESKNESVPE